MTDDEKHEWCRERGYPHAVFLYPHLYQEAERQDYDMRYYVKTKMMPQLRTALAQPSKSMFGNFVWLTFQ